MRKAFQDMEAALRENRMTLEAIRVTQSDRDLFKHLISEATNYVAADTCVTPTSAVSISTKPGVSSRVHTSRQQLAAEQYKHVDMRVSWQSTTVPKAIWKRIIRWPAIT